MNQAQKDRLFELLSDEALDGLTNEERMELGRLKKQFPEWENDFSIELAAAAINLSDFGDAAKTVLPANLKAKILKDADLYFSRAEETAPKSLTTANDASEADDKARRNSVRFEPAKSSFFGQWLGWAVAAAACVALAVNLWLTYARPQTQIVKNQEPAETPKTVRTPIPNIEPPIAVSALEQRERLLARAPDVIKTDLKAADVKSLKELSGDVVWSNSQQKGFAHFRGLPANDAARETYQLWIVDASRNEKTPVSGGVFDVPENGEVVIPVDAQLEIKSPKAFAVTREKPGGVVVSSPQRIVAIGKI